MRRSCSVCGRTYIVFHAGKKYICRECYADPLCEVRTLARHFFAHKGHGNKTDTTQLVHAMQVAYGRGVTATEMENEMERLEREVLGSNER